jgi:dTDP-4-dehydrorhamnose reductase
MTVVGVSRHQSEDNSIIGPVDPCDSDVLDRIWRDVRPQFCVHAAAISDPDECELNRYAAMEANVGFTRAVCRAAIRWKTRVLLTSTDYVFDGKKPSYDESDATNPVQLYGETKVAAEALVSKLPDSIILRLPLLYGAGANGNFIGQVFDALEENKIVYQCATRIRYPLYMDDLANVVLNLFSCGHSGTFHISGPTGITRWAWARQVAELTGHDPSLVQPRPDGMNETGAIRPGDIRLDDGKLNHVVNVRLTSLRQGTEQVLAAYKVERQHWVH